MSILMFLADNPIPPVVTSFTAGTASGNNPTGGASASGTITFKSDGTVTWVGSTTNNSINGSLAWLQNSPITGGGNSYWIRATATVGAPTTGTTGSWLALSSDRAWVKSGTTGSGSCTLTFEIATDSGGSNIVLTTTGNVASFTHAPA